MKATGDVCGRDTAHDIRIGANAIRAKGFADVAVQVDGGSHAVTCRSVRSLPESPSLSLSTKKKCPIRRFSFSSC